MQHHRLSELKHQHSPLIAVAFRLLPPRPDSPSVLIYLYLSASFNLNFLILWSLNEIMKIGDSVTFGGRRLRYEWKCCACMCVFFSSFSLSNMFLRSEKHDGGKVMLKITVGVDRQNIADNMLMTHYCSRHSTLPGLRSQWCRSVAKGRHQCCWNLSLIWRWCFWNVLWYWKWVFLSP